MKLLFWIVVLGLGYFFFGGHLEPFKEKISTFQPTIKTENTIGSDNQASTSANVTLSTERANHILYGDGSGGGHKYGVGQPCKSEFPMSWNDEKIINTVKKIAANDNLQWRKEDNGYYVSESMEDDVKIRVVLDGEKQGIITSYPVNVPRNPCPKRRGAQEPANDNY